MAHRTELFKVPKAALLVGGVMPSQLLRWSTFYKKIYKIISFLLQFIYALCLVFFSTEIFRIAGSNTRAAAASLKCMTFATVIFAKLILIQSDKMRILLVRASKEEDRINRNHDGITFKMYSECVRYSNVTSFVIMGVITFSGAFFIIEGLSESNSDITENNSNYSQPLRRHPVQIWFPFDKNKYYGLALSYEVFHIVGTVVYCSVTQPLVVSVMVFLKAELKLLQHFLRNIKHNDALNTKESLIFVVKKYQKIIEFIEEFNKSFQYIVLLEYCVTSLILAAILIDVIQGVKMQFNLSFFLVSLFQLYSLSWNANEIIIESSTGLSMAILDTDWYNMNKECTCIIQMMLLRCSKPLSISILGIGQLTIDAAISRTKLTYSVFSVLSTS
ncbi:hypothetical protein GWI33_000246 [Rhynchophorus ferrugineus]|uniref:Odorant receptor n=1 Tax=Rhynchophorus ferrugineus TaxID=354439 RepID=A0A834IWU9_RHYFE|nr:hypothetical protein GWI33_000246 [Rhynchophorus ferrugineus]